MNMLYDINVLTYIFFFYKMFLFPLSRYSRCVLQNDQVLESQKKGCRFQGEPAVWTCGLRWEKHDMQRAGGKFLDDSVMILQVFD